MTEPDCGTAFMTAGQARRFFGKLAPDGTVHIRGCSADKLLDAEELAAARVAAPAPAPAVQPDASPPAAPPPRAKSGCAAGGSPGGLVAIAIGLGLVARRRRLP